MYKTRIDAYLEMNHFGRYAFETNANSSKKYSEKNASGKQFMLLVKVITGDYCVDEHYFNEWPRMTPHENFDSVVDKLPSPTKVTVCNSSSALTEYMLKFVEDTSLYC